MSLGELERREQGGSGCAAAQKEGRAGGAGKRGDRRDTRLAKLALPARPAAPAARGSHSRGRNRGNCWHRQALRAASDAQAAATRERCGAAWAGPRYPGDSARSLARLRQVNEDGDTTEKRTQRDFWVITRTSCHPKRQVWMARGAVNEKNWAQWWSKMVINSVSPRS